MRGTGDVGRTPLPFGDPGRGGGVPIRDIGVVGRNDGDAGRVAMPYGGVPARVGSGCVPGRESFGVTSGDFARELPAMLGVFARSRAVCCALFGVPGRGAARSVPRANCAGGIGDGLVARVTRPVPRCVSSELDEPGGTNTPLLDGRTTGMRPDDPSCLVS